MCFHRSDSRLGSDTLRSWPTESSAIIQRNPYRVDITQKSSRFRVYFEAIVTQVYAAR